MTIKEHGVRPMPRKNDAPDEEVQAALLSDYISKLLDRATNGASKSSRRTATRMLSALALAARFGGLPKMREVARVLRKAAA